ncbi:MAG: class I SAM-dependent methyltransferase [Candidatus Cloacimonetes bacterium]|nr:class I SAM-dependent methyltransferase [Candidatus Cloacimonadota bacterium]
MPTTIYKYDEQTINSSNIIVRYSHRNRMKKSLKYVLGFLSNKSQIGYKILDYGCGTGYFISQINELFPDIAIGFEPIISATYQENLAIYKNFNDVKIHAPFKIITLFEVLEHLQWNEINDILNRCRNVLLPDGAVFISVPIELGPAVIFKEIHRYKRTKKWNYEFSELIKTVCFGKKAKRVNPDDTFMEHKGFDFRDLIYFIQQKQWTLKIIGYGPLAHKHWYGNSQIYLMLTS